MCFHSPKLPEILISPSLLNHHYIIEQEEKYIPRSLGSSPQEESGYGKLESRIGGVSSGNEKKIRQRNSWTWTTKW